jgi:hypothetical protein
MLSAPPLTATATRRESGQGPSIAINRVNVCKRLLCCCFGQKTSNLLFLKKKKQKNFYSFRCAT